MWGLSFFCERGCKHPIFFQEKDAAIDALLAARSSVLVLNAEAKPLFGRLATNWFGRDC
jgi:hypothetical protein